MNTVLMINAEWNLTEVILSAEVSSCQTHVNICGVHIRKLHYCAKPKRGHLWMELLVEKIG